MEQSAGTLRAYLAREHREIIVFLWHFFFLLVLFVTKKNQKVPLSDCSRISPVPSAPLQK